MASAELRRVRGAARALGRRLGRRLVVVDAAARGRDDTHDPEERAWMEKVFGHFGFVDVLRELNQEPGQYTWWSNRHPTTWERNVGWRLDYQVATPALASRVKRVAIDTETRFSDHAPLLFDYPLPASLR